MTLSTDASPNRSSVRRLIAFVRRILAVQPVRFLMVGGLNTVFGYILFSGFYLISHQRQMSLVASTATGVLFNYFTTGRLVFASRGYGLLVPFILGYAVVLGANMASLEGLIRVGVPTLAAQAVILPPMVVLSYVINRYIVFAGAASRLFAR